MSPKLAIENAEMIRLRREHARAEASKIPDTPQRAVEDATGQEWTEKGAEWDGLGSWWEGRNPAADSKGSTACL